MRLGIISDAHGNAAALERCLLHLRKEHADRILFLGDAVGYLPDGARVAHLLESADALCLKGNHEAMLTGELPISASAEEITGLRRFTDGLPSSWLEQVDRHGPKIILELSGKRLLLVHGAPSSPFVGRIHRPEDITDGDIPEGIDVILTGHTHRPMHCYINGRLLLNPGSCGLPRDRGDLLSLAVLDLETMNAAVHRLHFETLCERPGIHPKVKECLKRRSENPFGLRCQSPVPRLNPGTWMSEEEE